MPDGADDLEKLLLDVRKNISDNRYFLEKLVNETIDDDSGDDLETIPATEEFEEL